MASRVITTLVDDVDGSEAQHSVPFSIGGTDYLIDLSDKNAAAFQKVLAPWIEKAQKLGKSGKGGKRGPLSLVHSDGPSASDVREWAESEGIPVSSRGRIPGEISDLYTRRDKLTAEDVKLITKLRPVQPVAVPTEEPEVKAPAKRTARRGAVVS